MGIIEIADDNIKELWNGRKREELLEKLSESLKKIINRWPLLYPSIHQEFELKCEGNKDEIGIKLDYGGIIFVGLNPSFNEKFIEKNIEKKKEDMKGITKILRDYSKYRDKEEKVRLFETYTWQEYDYFRSIYCKILGKLKLRLPFYHVDLLLLRTTYKSEVERIFRIRNGVPRRFPEFFEEQLSIAIDLIKRLSPKIIVVYNSLASDILKSEKKEELFWDNSIGTYKIHLDNQIVPIIFSGYGPALDAHSRERLIWQINFILEKEKSL